jgi:hypothetical protein
MGRSSESSSKMMMRQHSHTSATSNSTASPKGRLNFFKKWPSTSASGPVQRDDTGSSEKIFEVRRYVFPRDCFADQFLAEPPVRQNAEPEFPITRARNNQVFQWHAFSRLLYWCHPRYRVSASTRKHKASEKGTERIRSEKGGCRMGSL